MLIRDSSAYMWWLHFISVSWVTCCAANPLKGLPWRIFWLTLGCKTLSRTLLFLCLQPPPVTKPWVMCPLMGLGSPWLPVVSVMPAILGCHFFLNSKVTELKWYFGKVVTKCSIFYRWLVENATGTTANIKMNICGAIITEAIITGAIITENYGSYFALKLFPEYWMLEPAVRQKMPTAITDGIIFAA